LKKIIVILIVLSMVLSLLLPIIVNAEKEDLSISAGKSLESMGVLEGNINGDLMLDKILNRQDMVVLISRLYKEENRAKSFLIKPKFSDITNEFYASYIAWSTDKGLIKGVGNDKFGFGKDTTVHEFQALLLRVLGYNEESNLWNSVPELAVKLGIMDGLENNPGEKLSRGQMAVMTLNTLKLTKKGSTITLAEFLNIKLD